ncbi:hypothetical protein DPMN_180653 [Dreissena polymorpha]|uniref:Uncharacterized protein n=1 Tax=Dreissena polymorpha TaxID=45954 RepID=A0A9D4EH97_DREPO|nr:hypothetical protein DPMN_180653 [Dreissena polymorpha]
MMVQHRPGAKHGNADALSRVPDGLSPFSSYLSGIKLSDLPCGGCLYCTRAEKQWGQFIEEVDEAVSLATGSLTNIRVKKTVAGSAILVPNLDQLHNGDAADGDELCRESSMDNCAGLKGETDRKIWDPGGTEENLGL